MNFPFDPAAPDFAAQVSHMSGYPNGDDLPIQAMVFEANAVERLPELLTSIGAKADAPLFVVVDELVIRRKGEPVKPWVQQHLQKAGWSPEAIVLQPKLGEPLHTDMFQVERVQSRLTPTAAVIAIGSGTVTDVAKHACFLYEKATGSQIPFIVMPTANSVSAYTSNSASVEVGGVKKTLPSRYPDVLVCDLATLASAPRSATVAGVGDLVVAFGSFADWYLAKRVGLDSNYSDLPRTLIGPLDETFVTHAEAIKEATPEGTEILAKLLALEGIATSLAHTTAPFSGFEHLISHVMDMLTSHYKLAPVLHGTQVALLTVMTTLAYRDLFNRFDPAQVDLDSCYPSAEEMQARIQAAFLPLDPSGGIANECWSDYKKKLDAWHAQRPTFEKFLQDWSSIRADLETIVRPPELLIEILQRMDSPTHFEQLKPPTPEEHLRFAFINASYIRNRFTLGDLLIFLNWDMSQVWDSVWSTSRTLASAPAPIAVSA